jgi:hypothetical protein
MAERPRTTERVSIEVAIDTPAAALRYFAPAGQLSGALERAGLALPEVGRVRQRAAHLLAWRSPTETLCLTSSAAALEQLAEAVVSAGDGCLIELTGALHVISLSGARGHELLLRLGGAAVPAPGEARRSRMADVPVLALSLSAGEVHLVIERTYGEHVRGWLEATLRDLR